jgi:hypothetical protein
LKTSKAQRLLHWHRTHFTIYWRLVQPFCSFAVPGAKLSQRAPASTLEMTIRLLRSNANVQHDTSEDTSGVWR